MHTDSEFVLKTRTDVHIDPEFIRNNLPLSGRNRVWIPWYQRLRPFYMADECFYGTKERIRALVNYDTWYDNNKMWGITHMRRFAHPHINNPIVSKYMRTGEVNDEILSLYYSIINHEFFVLPAGITFLCHSGKNI